MSYVEQYYESISRLLRQTVDEGKRFSEKPLISWSMR